MNKEPTQMPMVEAVLLDSMGSDYSIVRAARVSFDKDNRLHRSNNFPLSDRDQKLIQYLAKHGHWTPFAHTCLTFYVQAPIFVARQLAKHQVGLVWNEVSRRYIDSDPQIYKFGGLPLRRRAQDKKQGSMDDTVENAPEAAAIMDLVDANSLKAYNRLLELDVCPEQARSVLPMSTMTKWYWTGSLHAFSRVCMLRSSASTQYETRLVVPQISAACLETFPYAWKALSDLWSFKELA